VRPNITFFEKLLLSSQNWYGFFFYSLFYYCSNNMENFDKTHLIFDCKNILATVYWSWGSKGFFVLLFSFKIEGPNTKDPLIYKSYECIYHKTRCSLIYIASLKNLWTQLSTMRLSYLLK